MSSTIGPRIRILSCSDSSRWYANLVGQLVPYCGQDENELLSKDNGGYLNVVKMNEGRVEFPGEGDERTP